MFNMQQFNMSHWNIKNSVAIHYNNHSKAKNKFTLWPAKTWFQQPSCPDSSLKDFKKEVPKNLQLFVATTLLLFPNLIIKSFHSTVLVILMVFIHISLSRPIIINKKIQKIANKMRYSLSSFIIVYSSAELQRYASRISIFLHVIHILSNAYFMF